jgi:hypothetical protein
MDTVKVPRNGPHLPFNCGVIGLKDNVRQNGRTNSMQNTTPSDSFKTEKGQCVAGFSKTFWDTCFKQLEEYKKVLMDTVM